MWRHSIFLRSAGGLVWTACATIARIFLIAGASAFGQRCAPANKRSAGKVPLAPIAGDSAIDLPPVGDCYFRSGPDTNIIRKYIPYNSKKKSYKYLGI
jgi:hypothetical protein